MKQAYYVEHTGGGVVHVVLLTDSQVELFGSGEWQLVKMPAEVAAGI